MSRDATFYIYVDPLATRVEILRDHPVVGGRSRGDDRPVVVRGPHDYPCAHCGAWVETLEHLGAHIAAEHAPRPRRTRRPA